jgi:nucleotide-binding universal stress UspA family protein
MKGNSMPSYKHILVPTDGSTLSLKAAKAAAALARDLGARITAVYVTAPYMPTLNAEGALIVNHGFDQRAYNAATEKHAAAALGKIAAAAGKVKCAQVHVSFPSPWQGIIGAAKKNKCDLIVMASHGRRGLAGLLLGSETLKVLTHSKTPVLVCR